MKPKLNKDATQRQLEVLSFIIDYKKEKDMSPTFREIASGMNITVKGAFDHVECLERKGYVSHIFNVCRSIKVLRYPEEAA